MSSTMPELSAKNTTAALRACAVAKFLRDELKDADKMARAYLVEQAMNPGDRLTITDDTGAPVGTASLSKPRVRGGWVISDPVAFAAWCDARGIHHGGRVSVEFPDWVHGQANLEAMVNQAGGEIPDGLSDERQEGAPSLSIRMTAEQKQQLLANFTTPTAMLEGAHVFTSEIEEGEDQ